jgi:hypothetical protein
MESDSVKHTVNEFDEKPGNGDLWRRLQALEKRIDEWREGQNAVLQRLSEMALKVNAFYLEIVKFENHVNEKLQTRLIEPVKMTGFVKNRD